MVYEFFLSRECAVVCVGNATMLAALVQEAPVLTLTLGNSTTTLSPLHPEPSHPHCPPPPYPPLPPPPPPATSLTWKAMPQHCPLLLKTGPPLLPPLIAASI